MNSQRKIGSRSDVGAWVFKGNPEQTWDYFSAVVDEGRLPGVPVAGCWTVGNTYRTDMIEPGDLMVL